MAAHVSLMVSTPFGGPQTDAVQAGMREARARHRRGLTPAEFAAHAATQVLHGRRLVTEHAPDGTGCCRVCGRPSPCSLAREGANLVQHFGPWMPEPTLVRPYVDPARRAGHA
jgi:hypothetical protein